MSGPAAAGVRDASLREGAPCRTGHTCGLWRVSVVRDTRGTREGYHRDRIILVGVGERGGGSGQECNGRGGSQRRPQKRLDTRFEGLPKRFEGRLLSVTNAIEPGIWRQGDVAGHGWVALEGGAPPPLSNASRRGGGGSEGPEMTK